MNNKALKNMLSKANTLATLISFILIVFGLIILVSTLMNEEDKKLISIVLSIVIGGGMVILGSIAFKRLLSDQIKAMRGTHPILQAIKAGDRDFLIWVYVEEINATLGQEGPKLGASQNVNYFTKDCNGFGKTIMTGKKHSASELIAYLSTEFDIPYTDYSNRTRAAMNSHFGTSGLKEL